MPSLAFIRRKAGLSQRQLAALIGRTGQSIANWEAGRNSPSLPALEKLAAALNVTIDDLLKRPG